MKIFTTTFLFALLSVTAFSQNLTVGIKGGTSTTTFKGEYQFSNSDIYDNPKTSSITLSEYVNYKLSSYLSVQAEVCFQKKGFKYQSNIANYADRGSAEFGYLQIPILLQFCYGNKLKVFANGGPSINFLISDGEYKHFYTPYSHYYTLVAIQPIEKIENIKSDFNKIILGVIGSAGLSYDITPTIGILGEFRVGYDLTKSSKNKIAELIELNNSLPESYNSYHSPVSLNDTHFLSYSVQGGVYFRLGK
jgi:hypothetical protein